MTWLSDFPTEGDFNTLSILSFTSGDSKQAFREINDLTKPIKVKFNNLRGKSQEHVSANWPLMILLNAAS